jgi:cytochrome c oxidase subunit II
MTARAAVVPAFAVLLTACGSIQSAFGGEGAEGANFVCLFSVFLVVCTIFYLVIAAGLIASVWRRRRSALTLDDRRHHEMTAGSGIALVTWTGLIVAGLAALTVASFFTDRSNAASARNPKLILTVTANQWWWDVEYHSPDASRTVHTANEIHLPAGVPAEVILKSNDVIHSLWIPNLAGKQDLIPGRQTDLQLLPAKLGLYRGQCAEFCGIDHALMALDITVESKADFQRWYQHQLKTAAPPTEPLQLAGYDYVITRECSGCHNIAGTPASGQVAPDLTHFASRRSIAAGTLPMSRDNLARWLADPQAQKPGNHMPTVGLAPGQVRAVTSYLETLQ